MIALARELAKRLPDDQPAHAVVDCELVRTLQVADFPVSSRDVLRADATPQDREQYLRLFLRSVIEKVLSAGAVPS